MIKFPNILWSYAYISENKKFDLLVRKIISEANTRVLIDSGAYTAYKLGKQIELKDYTNYIKILDGLGGAWNVIQLDVLGNEEKTKRNLDQMYNQGVRPMPVLTVDMHSSKAKELVEYNKYICLAGGQKFWKGAKDWQWRRALDVDKFTDGKAKSHFLAFVRTPDLYKLPINSGDSSTWLAGQQFTRIACYVSGGRLTGGTFYHQIHHHAKKDLCTELVRHLNHDRITKTVWQDEKLMIGSSSSYCTLKTATSFSALCNHASKRNKQIFLASGGNDLEMLSSVCTHGDDMGYLDFIKAKKMLRGLIELRKKDYNSWMNKIIEVINTCNEGVKIENTNSC